MKRAIVFKEENESKYNELVYLQKLAQIGEDEYGIFTVLLDENRAAKHYINSDMVWDDEDEMLLENSPNLVGMKLLRLHCIEIENNDTYLREDYLLLTANTIKNLDPTYNGEIEVLEKYTDNTIHRSLYLFTKKNNSKEYNYYYIKNLE